MSKEYTLSPHQVEEALIDYMKECVVRDGLGHTYNISFKHDVEPTANGMVEVTFKGVDIKVGDYNARHKK